MIPLEFPFSFLLLLLLSIWIESIKKFFDWIYCLSRTRSSEREKLKINFPEIDQTFFLFIWSLFQVCFCSNNLFFLVCFGCLYLTSYTDRPKWWICFSHLPLLLLLSFFPIGKTMEKNEQKIIHNVFITTTTKWKKKFYGNFLVCEVPHTFDNIDDTISLCCSLV